MKYILFLEAYAKIMLHVHKYPSFQVHGVLLGKEEDSNVNIVDSVPLFHGQILAPLCEVALTMIEEYCKNKGLKIVGCYHANEHIEDRSLHSMTTRIADKIHEQYPSSCILLVDNTKVSLEPSELALELYTSVSKQWKLNASGSTLELKDSNVFQILKSYLEDKLHWKLIDFDTHLDDTSKDFFNSALFA